MVESHAEPRIRADRRIWRWPNPPLRRGSSPRCRTAPPWSIRTMSAPGRRHRATRRVPAGPARNTSIATAGLPELPSHRSALAAPILILGAPRSGTTWLAKIIDSHPDVLYRHEPDETLPGPSPLTPDALAGAAGALGRRNRRPHRHQAAVFPEILAAGLGARGHGPCSPPPSALPGALPPPFERAGAHASCPISAFAPRRASPSSRSAGPRAPLSSPEPCRTAARCSSCAIPALRWPR